METDGEQEGDGTMMGRRVLAWFALAMLCVSLCGPLFDLLLWAQEGALGEAEKLEKRSQKVSRLSSRREPSQGPAASEEAATGKPHRWANMNWFALYLVLAGPITYFVFRGAAR